jgi:hypothetical protein
MILANMFLITSGPETDPLPVSSNWNRFTCQTLHKTISLYVQVIFDSFYLRCKTCKGVYLFVFLLHSITTENTKHCIQGTPKTFSVICIKHATSLDFSATIDCETTFADLPSPLSTFVVQCPRFCVKNNILTHFSFISYRSQVLHQS